MTKTVTTDIIPLSCDTPLHTIDALRAAIKDPEKTHDGLAGNSFLNSLDTRVLEWLLNDAEQLNKLISRVAELS